MNVGLAFGIVLLILMLGIGVGLPLSYVFGFVGVIFFLMLPAAPLDVLMPSAMKIMLSFAMLSLPLYIAIGRLMEVGVLSSRLVDWLNTLVGRGKSMFGAIGVLFCAFFGAISGSAVSAVAAVGSILIPKTKEYGYDKAYVTGLIACSSLISMLIPPSLPMIIFGVTSELSISLCFLTTAIPGCICVVLYIIINYFSTRKILPVAPVSLVENRAKAILHSTKRAASALLLPVIILGGIYGGIFTPTEAAAVALTWVIFDGFVIHREFIPKFRSGLLESAKTIGSIGAILFFIYVMSQAMIWMRVPQLIQSSLFGLIYTKVGFLIVVNILLIIMGMIMEAGAVVILAACLLLPIAVEYGINPYHFAAIVGVGTGVGNLSPPVAAILYFAADVGGVPVNFFPPSKYFKTVLRFLIFGHVPLMILVSCFPQISLFLPNLWLGR